jgi:hypothetical protein
MLLQGHLLAFIASLRLAVDPAGNAETLTAEEMNALLSEGPVLEK